MAETDPRDALLQAAIDPRDALLQAHVPAVMVPRFTPLQYLGRSGHRYLIAQDGLWLEVRRPWLHLVWPVAPSAAPLPYGGVDERMDFEFEWDAFLSLLTQFYAAAFRALPNEHAAWFIWDEKDRALRYRAVFAKSASPGSLELQRPPLAPHEHLAVDVHSHGFIRACFSATDDMDDAGEVKLSVVIGNLENPDNADEDVRLCAQGLFIPFEAKD